MSTPAATTTMVRKALRIADADVARILDELDADVRDAARQKQNFSYRVPALRVRFEGAGEETVAAPSRWISRTGIAFLHGRFIHQKVAAHVQLITIHGTWNDAKADVVACRYIAPHVYEIELAFLQPIDPAMYCTKAGSTRVFLVDDQQLLARLVTHQLKELNATVEYCEKAKLAYDLAMNGRFDLVLMDINMPEKSGEDILRELRENGYTGRVVAFTATAEEKARERLLSLGFDDVLGKPFTRAALEQALEACRTEPIISTLAEDPAMERLIGDFVGQLRQWVRDLQKALNENNAAVIVDLAREMRAQGGLFGFDVISAKAGDIERAALEPDGLKKAREHVNRLGELARLVRAPRKKSS